VLFDISFVSAERHAHIPTTRKDQVFSSTLRVESPSVYSVARKNAARVHHQDAHPANARGGGVIQLRATPLPRSLFNGNSSVAEPDCMLLSSKGLYSQLKKN